MTHPNRLFEDEVRRTAEAVWNLDPGACQAKWYNTPPLYELDGIARLPDITHLLMITTSGRLDKVKDDVRKLNVAENKERKSRRDVPIQKWLITQRQLEAEQTGVAQRHSVSALTHAQFQRRFFNGSDYFNKRKPAAFGSARNLRDGSITVPDDEYVSLPMHAQRTPILGHSQDAGPVTINDIVELLENGSSVVLLGPFGAGKSLTTREVFLTLARNSSTDTRAPLTPVAINCREHWGAIFGYEILERHAQSIGFQPRHHLTVAWRAGMVYLLLDGFDELAAQTISTPTNRNFMRQARHEALKAVRDLVGKAPAGTGVLLCGRDHYFDNLSELTHSLGIANRELVIVRIGEFTEDQAASFLRRRATTQSLPDWLPRKPLILGYLAHQDLLDQVLAIDASHGFGYAWDSFLTLVCKREAEHGAAMEDRAIRRVLEALACMVRESATGTRPITGPDLAEVYQSQIGDVAGEAVLMQLQRLPGLTARDQDPMARSFVDSDMLAALQGGAVATAIMENSAPLVGRKWAAGLTRDGVRMAAYMLRKHGYEASTVLAAAKLFSKDYDRTFVGQLIADCAAIVLELSSDDEIVDCQQLEVNDAHLHAIDLEERAVIRLTVHGCLIDTVSVGRGLTNSLLRFEGCVVGRVMGVPSEDGLPVEMFRNCHFDGFDDASTNAAVLKLKIPDGQKVLLTVLRKLYLQAGGGRKLGALRRGLPGHMKNLVDQVVGVLKSEGIVVVSNQVAHPVRKHTARVNGVLRAGRLSDDPLISRVSEV